MSKFARARNDGLVRRLAPFIGKRAVPDLRNDSRGTSAVEFALVFPFFLLLLLGIVEFGRALKSWNEVQFALGKAIRLVHLEDGTGTTEIVTAMKGYLSGVSAEDLAVTAHKTTISGVEYLKIEVSFPFTMHIPFSDISSLNISVDAIAPIMGPLR